MNFLKTSFLSSISTVIRIFSGLISTKFIAIYVGPSGLALIAQLQNFINIIFLFSGGFLTTALTKYTSQYSDDEIKSHRIWSAAIQLMLAINFILFLLFFFFSEFFSLLLFSNKNYSYIVEILSVSQIFSGINVFFLSIANGKKKVKKYIVVNILSSFVSLFLVVGLSYYFSVDGVMVAYTISQSVVLIITILILKNEIWFGLENFIVKFKCEDVKVLFKFAAITFTSIMSANISLMLVRKIIESNFSLEETGVWQATWNITQISMTLLTTSFAVYILPVFSSLKRKVDYFLELKKIFLLVVPVSFLISFLVYILRDFVILILYTEEFKGMRDLIAFYMIGSFFKIICWVFGYIFVAQAKVMICIFVEITMAFIFVVLNYFFIDIFGFIGSSYAYALYSILNLFLLLYLFSYKFNPDL
ncbi:O-antigen translocase [Marinomonas polaris]|uniref:O-antigen translocase n=1 Tax=Marinomonas polaris TaxID=293552 RepID=UPI0035144C44